MRRRLSLLALIVTALALVLVVAGPALAQSAGSMFDYLIARKLLVRGTSTMIGALTATGGVTGNLTGNVTGDLTGDVIGNVTGDVTGAVTVDDWMRIMPQTAITVTNGGTITPTGSFQLLTAAGNVGTSSVVTTTTAGRMLWLFNTSAYTITLTDTAPLYLSGNLVLSPADSAILMSQDSKWYQFAGETN